MSRARIPGGTLMVCDWAGCETCNPQGKSWRTPAYQRRQDQADRKNWSTLMGPKQRDFCPKHSAQLINILDEVEALHAAGVKAPDLEMPE